MAQKRMFDKSVIDTDKFMDLPNDSKALYFLLGMEADDEGFVSPRRVIKLHGFTDDVLKILILKNFVIPFETGVVVITHWKQNNYLDKNRIKETQYSEEKKNLTTDNQDRYMLNNGLTEVKQMFNQYSIEENRIEESNIHSPQKFKKTKNKVVVSSDENKLKQYAYKDLQAFIEDKELVIKHIKNLGYTDVENYVNNVIGYCKTSVNAKKYLDLTQVAINWLSRDNKKQNILEKKDEFYRPQV